MARRYWLMKSEPDKYAWGALLRDGKTFWDGVRAMGIALTPVVDRVFVTASSLVWEDSWMKYSPCTTSTSSSRAHAGRA